MPEFRGYPIHGMKLAQKLGSDSSPSLTMVSEAYHRWIAVSMSVTNRTQQDIEVLVAALNEYKDAAEPVFDARPNSAQEVLQPSIIEEFMGHLFAPLAVGRENLVLRPDRGYLSLVFHPRDAAVLAESPEFTISRKDHDFVIGGAFTLRIEGPGGVREERVVVPAVAIECKRYLERNMLDECAGTAAKVKRATPYCLYLVVSEFLKMDDARPELSKIDEIYVLRKQRNSERLQEGFQPNPIDASLVCDLYDTVTRHMDRVWWNQESALTRGKVFDF